MRWSACREQPPWTPRQRSGDITVLKKRFPEILFKKPWHKNYFYDLIFFLIMKQRRSSKWSDDETRPKEDRPFPHDSALSWRCRELWLWHLPDHHRHGGLSLWPFSWGTALWMSSAGGKLMSNTYTSDN